MTTNVIENHFAMEVKVISLVCRADDQDDVAREMVCVVMETYVNKVDVFQRKGDMINRIKKRHSHTLRKRVFHSTQRIT